MKRTIKSNFLTEIPRKILFKTVWKEGLESVPPIFGRFSSKFVFLNNFDGGKDFVFCIFLFEIPNFSEICILLLLFEILRAIWGI